MRVYVTGVGVHGTFKEAMRLAAAESPGLTPHTSRDDSSAAIAFIDAAAVLLDILTFYNERFINEGFLATATERLSLLEMARSIGYELKPGVAASTHLAFDVQISPGMPETVQIEPGVQVQSIRAAGPTAADLRNGRIRRGTSGMEFLQSEADASADLGIGKAEPDHFRCGPESAAR